MKYYPQMSQSLSRDDSGNLKTDGYIDLSVGASFIPYGGSSGAESETDQNVTKSTQQESEAKEELQSVLNKINKQSKIIIKNSVIVCVYSSQAIQRIVN